MRMQIRIAQLMLPLIFPPALERYLVFEIVEHPTFPGSRRRRCRWCEQVPDSFDHAPDRRQGDRAIRQLPRYVAGDDWFACSCSEGGCRLGLQRGVEARLDVVDFRTHRP